jgi:hypothetical protein
MPRMLEGRAKAETDSADSSVLSLARIRAPNVFDALVVVTARAQESDQME